MRLQLKNIGKLSEADVEIKGVTVIAGENDTGKSTVGKVLFSVFNGFYDLERKIKSDRYKSISNSLDTLKPSTHDISFEIQKMNLLSQIVESMDNYQKNTMLLQNTIASIFNQAEFDDIEKTTQRIIDVLDLSRFNIMESLLQDNFKDEFDGQISRISCGEKSEISLTIRKEVASIELDNHAITSIKEIAPLETEVIYIDSPFVLDELIVENWESKSHKGLLKRKLALNSKQDNVVDALIVKKKMNFILEKLNTACDGAIIDKGTTFVYQSPKVDEPLSMKNVSTGIKMFAIIKRLIENGALGFNSTLILDEPEIHVHPKWQLVFAEIIVLLQKEFDMHILLNTHSPYFLEAIEVYSKKHKIADNCRYYLAKNVGDSAVIEDVTDNTEKIYQKLAEPFQTLENARYAE